MTHSASSTRDGRVLNKPRPAGDEYRFRAPRWSDLTACPSCQSTPDDFSRCDYCGSEGRLFKGAVS